MAAVDAPVTAPADIEESPVVVRLPDGYTEPSASTLPLIAHVWAAGEPTTEQVVALTVTWSMQRGWRAVIVVPDGPAWDRAVQCAVDDDINDIKVVRVPQRDNRGWGMRPGRRRTAGLGRWLVVEKIAVVHAHDDAAAATWRVAVRRTKVPMVWDVDLGAPPRRTDDACIAASSYLMTSRTGSRLHLRRQPPKRAVDGDPSSRIDVVDEVYRCLTGIEVSTDQHVIELPAIDTTGA